MNYIIPEKDLKTMLEKSGGTCVSLYMPTAELGRERRKHPIKYKNLLREVEESLLEMDMRPAAIKDFLKPARELITDSFFWRNQKSGLAVLFDQDWFQKYSLPLECETTVVVSDRFHLKPMLSLLATDGDYIVLSLSQNKVKVFECTPHSINEITPDTLPESMEEALKYDDPEKQLQFHTQTSGSGGKDQRSAMFHGHGVGIDDTKNDIFRFFRIIAKRLQPLLSEKQKPLLLAGVEFLHPIYRAANLYPDLVEDGIEGNTEKWTPKQLHEKSWNVMESYIKGKRGKALSRYKELKETHLADDNIRAIVPAAYEGRIDTLFVSAGSRQWGSFDPETQSLSLHKKQKPGDIDLSDYAAVHAYLKKGNVYVVDKNQLDGSSQWAAIFRY